MIRVQQPLNDAEKLQPAFDLACQVLVNTLSSRHDDIGEKAKAAIQVTSAYARLRATERAGQTLKYMVIKDFASQDPNVLKKLVRASLPELAPNEKLLRTPIEIRVVHKRGRGRPRRARN